MRDIKGGIKFLGVYRKVDKMGRIVIPKEMRDEVGLVEDFEALLAEIENEKVIVIRVPKESKGE